MVHPWSALCSREESLEQHRPCQPRVLGQGLEGAERDEAGLASAGMGSICISRVGKGD